MIKEMKNFVKFAEGGMDAIRMQKDTFLNQMYSLEMELGYDLVQDTPHGVVILTEFGKAFVSYANKCIQTLNSSINMAKERNIYDFDNQLTLGIAKDSASTWAINCINDFNRMHSGLRLSIFAHDWITEKMLDEATIIFWCIENELENYDKLWYIEYKYGLYASDEYLEKFGIPTLDNIKKHRIIAYSGNDNNTLTTNWHLYGQYGLPKLEPCLFSQSRDLIVKMAADGLGIGAVADRQDVYYGYTHLNRVLKLVDGPVLRSYFMVRKEINEQKMCNVDLISTLFKKYFTRRGIEVFNIQSHIVPYQ